MAVIERTQKDCNTFSGALGKTMTKLELQQQDFHQITTAVEVIQIELNVIRGNMAEIKEVNTNCKSMETSIGSRHASKLDEILNKLETNEPKTPTPMGPCGGRGNAM
jgi:hypothetical protein